MKVISKLGHEDIAVVYIAEMNNGRYIEFVESLEPPIPREQKWVNIVSTLFGCPVKCPICDAGNEYNGKLSAEEIFSQIDFLVKQRFASNVIPVEKWKIQFARMGEPAFNTNILDVLEILHERFTAPGLMPTISTIAPKGTDKFFTELLEIKEELYPERFQFQFSIHSTDLKVRQRLIPVKTWSFNDMACYGVELYKTGGRKITLNFALIEGVPIDRDVLLSYFNPDNFIIKITPLNPTFSVIRNNFKSSLHDAGNIPDTVSLLKDAGYEVIVSIGELEENAIGSNCGQYVSAITNNEVAHQDTYTYEQEMINVEI